MRGKPFFAGLSAVVLIAVAIGVTPVAKGITDPVASTVVHLGSGTKFADGVGLLRSRGVSIHAKLPSAHAAVVTGRTSSIRSLARVPGIARLEPPRALSLALETATWASRARSLTQGTGGLDLRVTDADGALVDGSGVGIATIDSGIAGQHPDLDWCGNGPVQDCKTVRNFKIDCFPDGPEGERCAGPMLMQDLEDSDTSSGHGTHVAGIAAGDGRASGGVVKGVAPGAKLYGFGVGDGTKVFTHHAAVAFQWIIDNHRDPLGNDDDPSSDAPPDPPIVVINNSYGGPGEFEPDSVLSKLNDAAIATGITVVWAAGNSGGQGDRDCTDTEDLSATPLPCTNYHGTNPTPGNIMVANYDDLGSGSRDARLAANSSRGVAADVSTWPDLSAPGQGILTTCKHPTICTGAGDVRFGGHYATMSGTSLAAPHVAGAVALLKQIDPSLTPAEVEARLEETARRFSFGQPYSASGSFDKGHGLLDARLAVTRSLGLPDDVGFESGKPAVTASAFQRGEGARVDLAGRAFSRVGGGPTGGRETLIGDETGSNDTALSSADLEWVKVRENGDRFEVDFKVRDPGLRQAIHLFRLHGSFGGTHRVLEMTWSAALDVIRCSGQVLRSCAVTRVAPNVFRLSHELDDLLAAGAAPRGTPVFNVWASSAVSVATEIAQDELPGGPLSMQLAPARGTPHVIVGNVPPIRDIPGSVSISVDGADPVVIASGIGEFDWSASITLPKGEHAIHVILRTPEGAASQEFLLTR